MNRIKTRLCNVCLALWILRGWQYLYKPNELIIEHFELFFIQYFIFNIYQSNG